MATKTKAPSKARKTAPKKAAGRKPRAAPKAKAINSPSTTASKFGETGTSGLKHSAGRIQDEFIRELEGYRGTKKLDEFRRNDAIAGGVLRAMTMLTRSVDWTVWPSEDESLSGDLRLDDAEFLESCQGDMGRQTWPEFIGEVATKYWAGFSLFEEVMKVRAGSKGATPSKYDDRNIGWAKLAFRAQETIERWALGPHGEIEGAEQRDPSGGGVFDIPEMKFLLFRTSTEKNNPMGESVLRSAFVDWCYKTGKEEVGAIAFERDGTGIPEFYIPADKMDADGDQTTFNYFKKMGKNIRVDDQACVILPSDTDEKGNRLYEFNLKSSPGTRSTNTNEEINRHNMAIAISCLAQWLLLGTTGVGSFALVDSHTNSFATALGGYLDMIAEVLNCVAIPRLWEINGWDRPTPYFKHGDIETQDIVALSGLLTAATGAGIDLTDPQTENEIRRVAGLPQTAEETAEDIEEGGETGGAFSPPAGDVEAAGENALLQTVGGLNALMELMAKVQAGEVADSNAMVVMQEVFGMSEDVARRMLARDEGLTEEPEEEPTE